LEAEYTWKGTNYQGEDEDKDEAAQKIREN
jgi:hypothetical protein